MISKVLVATVTGICTWMVPLASVRVTVMVALPSPTPVMTPVSETVMS